MARARRDPYPSFNFRVEIDGIEDAGFREVLMPSATIDVIEYREGGEAACSIRKLPGRVHFDNLVLRRGLTESNSLFEWWRAVCEGGQDRRNVVVTLLDAAGDVVKRFGFLRSLPARYEAPLLDASSSDVALETLELAFEGMTIE